MEKYFKVIFEWVGGHPDRISGHPLSAGCNPVPRTAWKTSLLFSDAVKRVQPINISYVLCFSTFMQDWNKMIHQNLQKIQTLYRFGSQYLVLNQTKIQVS